MGMTVGDKSGNPVILSHSTGDPAYRLAALGATLAATPTDFITLTGATGVVVRVKSVKLNGVATATGNMPVQLVRRSTANTGGTSTTPTIGKHDTNDATPAAVLTLYTANPASLGTTVAVLTATRMTFATTATGATVANQGWDFTIRGDKSLMLRGTGDILAINFNGAAVPTGGLLDWEVEWEEATT